MNIIWDYDLQFIREIFYKENIYYCWCCENELRFDFDKGYFIVEKIVDKIRTKYNYRSFAFVIKSKHQDSDPYDYNKKYGGEMYDVILTDNQKAIPLLERYKKLQLFI